MTMRHRESEDERQQFIRILGQLTTFTSAYPQVTGLDVEIIAKPGGSGESGVYRYSLKSLPGQFTPCPHPGCHHGGCNIGLILGDLIERRLTAGETSTGCGGTLKIRRKVVCRCPSAFVAKVRLEYADPSASGRSVALGWTR